MGKRSDFTRRKRNQPQRRTVERIAEESARDFGAPLSDVIHMRAIGPAHKARVEAWRRVLEETGCSVNGLADVWGCDRQAIWRAMRDRKAA